jgi:methionyl-tRNA formyltransferase
MRIILLTQNDPFYLAENLQFLIESLPKNFRIVGAVNFDVSPFGKKESFLYKSLKTLSIFGIGFFVHYSIRFLINFFNKSKNVCYVLEKNQIPLINLSNGVNDPKSLAIIEEYNSDIMVSIAGNQIFKQPLIDMVPNGILNLHTALLPKYRGLMPSFWVLKNCEEKTGVSVFFVDAGIDSGNIIIQREIIIGDLSQEELIKRTKRMGITAVVDALICIGSGNVNLIENDITKGSYYTFPTRSDVRAFYKVGKRFF